MDARTDTPRNNRNIFAIPVFASLMVFLWFVPDLVRSPPVFPFQTITQIEGTPLVALLTPPVAGALLLLLFAVRRPVRLVHAGSACIGMIAVTFLLLFGKPAFFVGSVGCLAMALSLGIFALLIHRRTGSMVFFYAILGALPIALLGYAAYGIITSAYPAAYLLPLKLPVSIFAALSAAAISVVDFRVD